MVTTPERPSPSRKTMKNGQADNPDRHLGQPRCLENHRVSFTERICNVFRRKISQNRARFEYQNIELDLAYITDRIIAMGYPSGTTESVYRNSMRKTQNFLYRRHGSNHVKVFNLRGGRFYNPEKFDNNVIYFDMKDHHPPSLELMAPFCREAFEWLDADKKNVIAVHCKAGKGRTGVMICAFLIYIKFYENPRQILDYYSIIRTKNNKGVTIPSQRRYIYYYDYLRTHRLNYFPARMQLIGLYLERPPKTKIRITVTNGTRVVFEPADLVISRGDLRREMNTWLNASDIGYERDVEGGQTTYVSNRAYCFMVPDGSPVFVEGDVRVDLLNSEPIGKPKKIGHVWFNTMFACLGMTDSTNKDDEFVYGDKKYPYQPGFTSIGRLGDLKDGEVLWEDTGKKPNDLTVSKWRIVKPPGIDQHVPEGSIEEIYEDYGMPAPRDRISHLLYNAHDKGIVKDDYNLRRFLTRGNSYTQIGRTEEARGVGGPFQIPLKEDEHVLTFPVSEMDRALKNTKLNNGMKLHVVLKCIDEDSEMFAKSEVFCNETYDENAKSDGSKYDRRYAPTEPEFGQHGAELKFPPLVRYALNGKYSGGPHGNLLTREFGPISNEEHWCRFYYKQRRDSISIYPPKNPICQLTGKEFKFPKHLSAFRENKEKGNSPDGNSDNTPGPSSRGQGSSTAAKSPSNTQGSFSTAPGTFNNDPGPSDKPQGSEPSGGPADSADGSGQSAQNQEAKEVPNRDNLANAEHNVDKKYFSHDSGVLLQHVEALEDPEAEPLPSTDELTSETDEFTKPPNNFHSNECNHLTMMHDQIGTSDKTKKFETPTLTSTTANLWTSPKEKSFSQSHTKCRS